MMQQGTGQAIGLSPDGKIMVDGGTSQTVDGVIEPSRQIVTPEGTDDFDGFYVNVDRNVTQLVGEDKERRTVTIVNGSTSLLMVGKLSQVQSRGGYALTQNVPLTITTFRPIFVSLFDPNAPAGFVSVWVERNLTN